VISLHQYIGVTAYLGAGLMTAVTCSGDQLGTRGKTERFFTKNTGSSISKKPSAESSPREPCLLLWLFVLTW